jgi:hypothetical protein
MSLNKAIAIRVDFVEHRSDLALIQMMCFRAIDHSDPRQGDLAISQNYDTG